MLARPHQRRPLRCTSRPWWSRYRQGITWEQGRRRAAAARLLPGLRPHRRNGPSTMADLKGTGVCSTRRPSRFLNEPAARLSAHRRHAWSCTRRARLVIRDAGAPQTSTIMCDSRVMRIPACIWLCPEDRVRLERLADRNTPRKVVWRSRTCRRRDAHHGDHAAHLAEADGVGRRVTWRPGSMACCRQEP